MDNSETTAKADKAAILERDSGRRAYLIVKRFQDIVLSALALVVLSPLLLVIALLIVIDDPHGGPLFSHERVGKNGQRFRMYKFRTMCVDAEAKRAGLSQYNEMDGPVFKIKHDPRITRAGGLLRRMSLDELPQLVNILRGDMSIVGPRPALPSEVEQYTDYQLQRLTVTPGLTCFWQVQPGRYCLTMDEWVELDLRYIRERSWLMDWKLIFRTIKAVLRAEGE